MAFVKYRRAATASFSLCRRRLRRVLKEASPTFWGDPERERERERERGCGRRGLEEDEWLLSVCHYDGK